MPLGMVVVECNQNSTFRHRFQHCNAKNSELFKILRIDRHASPAVVGIDALFAGSIDTFRFSVEILFHRAYVLHTH
jgi:hypothetical protein